MAARILIVDDEELMRATLVEIVRLNGYDAVAEESGEKAVARLRDEAFDLLLLDLKMPGMSGTETLRIVKEIAPEMAIILLTAHGSLESAIEALHMRVHDYLLKPASPNEILNSIASALGKPPLREASPVYRVNNEDTQRKAGEDTAGIYNLVQGEVVDLNRRVICWEGKKVNLTPTETRLLHVFLANPGQVLSHQEIVTQAQGYETRDWEASEILRPLISRLRRKLSSIPGGETWIVSVRGTGYLWEGTRPLSRSTEHP